ncbi:MAG: nucleotide exchange factor GrpE [Acidimicrobiales bacterium]
MTQAHPPDDHRPEPSGDEAPATSEPDVAGADPEPSTGASTRPDLEGLAPDDLESLATETFDRLDAVVAERDDYLDRLRRLQADFENYKKRSTKEHKEAGERATARLAESLLPVLDSCDAAMVHGATSVEPIFASLLGALEKEGLERVDPLDLPFDPEHHEAVLHEHDDEAEAPTVVEVLRPGYVWKHKVLRPAMVKVKG